jgi:hypothetical protein
MYSAYDLLAEGLPHSDIFGSKPARGSPKLFAACHVLRRLLVPRHPPNALRSLNLFAQCDSDFAACAATSSQCVPYPIQTSRLAPLRHQDGSLQPNPTCLRTLHKLETQPHHFRRAIIESLPTMHRNHPSAAHSYHCTNSHPSLLGTATSANQSNKTNQQMPIQASYSRNANIHHKCQHRAITHLNTRILRNYSWQLSPPN